MLVARDGHHYCCQGWPRMRTLVPRIVAKPAAADTQQSTRTQRRQLATPLPLFCNGYTWLQKLRYSGITHAFDTFTLVVMLKEIMQRLKAQEL